MSMPSVLARLFLMLAVLACAGCASVGQRFDTDGLRFLVPGQTTLQGASDLLQSPPASVYRALDGSATARWAHTQSLVTDAVYVNQEVWLSFDTTGRFVRIIRSNNVPLTHMYESGRRVDLLSGSP